MVMATLFCFHGKLKWLLEKNITQGPGTATLHSVTTFIIIIPITFITIKHAKLCFGNYRLGKAIFSQASVCPHGVGGLPARNPPGQTPPGQRPPWTETRQMEIPWTEIPLDIDPPRQRPHWTETTRTETPCKVKSGRYENRE